MTTSTPKSKARVKAPVSKATNAYDLLADVCRVIREEPARYFQDRFYVADTTAQRHWLDGRREPPMCGTMACRAGWVVQLRDGHIAGEPMQIDQRARDILSGADGNDGVFQRALTHLFAGGAIDWELKPGTIAYARAGIYGVRQFMAKHKARLKATTFPRKAKATHRD